MAIDWIAGWMSFLSPSTETSTIPSAALFCCCCCFSVSDSNRKTLFAWVFWPRLVYPVAHSTNSLLQNYRFVFLSVASSLARFENIINCCAHLPFSVFKCNSAIEVVDAVQSRPALRTTSYFFFFFLFTKSFAQFLQRKREPLGIWNCGIGAECRRVGLASL